MSRNLRIACVVAFWLGYLASAYVHSEDCNPPEPIFADNFEVH